MLSTILMQMLISSSVPTPAQPVLYSAVKGNNASALTIAYSGRVAPGPDHGDDPNRERHDQDPYNWTTTNGRDPYGGSTSNGSDPYGGRAPGAPVPSDPYGGNVPD